MNKKISGVILAGGNGKRLNGLIKSKIIIEGKTIISRIIEQFDGLFDEILIITNAPEEFAEYSDCKITGDHFINKGPLGGIHSALKAAGCETLFIIAGDMPFIRKDFIVKQIEYFYNNGCDILVPRIDNYIEPLHGIYRKSVVLALEDYLEAGKNCAIREFFKMADIQYMDFAASEESKRAFTNINSPSDILIVKQLPGLPGKTFQ